MKICPFCAEEVQDAAIKCRYCQSLLSSTESEATDEQPPASLPRPPRSILMWVCAVIGVVVLGSQAFAAFEAGQVKAGLLGILFVVGFVFLTPVAWSLGDTVRRFAMPTSLFVSGGKGGFTAMVKAKLFWLYGPQVMAVVILAGVALVIVDEYTKSEAKGRPREMPIQALASESASSRPEVDAKELPRRNPAVRAAQEAVERKPEEEQASKRLQEDVLRSTESLQVDQASGGGAGTGTGSGLGSGQGSGLGPGYGGGTGGGVYRPGNGVDIPRLIRDVKPQYTADAMRAKIQGVVLLECIVLPDGSVGDVKVKRSLDPTFGLDQEAVKAARQWRFIPGMRLGEPVAVIVSIELSFSLR